MNHRDGFFDSRADVGIGPVIIDLHIEIGNCLTKIAFEKIRRINMIPKKWPCLIQLPTLLLVPIIVIWNHAPTYVLNTGTGREALEFAGIIALMLVMFFSIPAGIIGIRSTRESVTKKNRQCRLTRILSIANLVVGIHSIGLVILVFFAILEWGPI